MKSIFLVLLFAFSSIAGVSVFAQKSLPEVSLNDIDGNKVQIADYAKDGKITVFSFWATWCSPCKKELSNISALYEDWQEAYDVEVVAVSIDDQRNTAKIKPYVSGQGWEYTVLLDVNEDLKRALNFQSVPFTLVVDKEGNIAYEHNGYVEGDEYELEHIIAELAEKE
ncbi:MAG: TlpA disulfide reductase family protein [Chitinophagales bacterium]|nr:TlpA family protein disulfide reductase [Bacteroidota bacterium]MCB9044330.1 TlpA family protein disulfide reductase [Chitinophagales bacterium]